MKKMNINITREEARYRDSLENADIIYIVKNGCVYDVPNNIETAEQFESLICGYNNGRLAESQREELYNQPKLLGLNGPMFNGYATLSTGEIVPIIRYEKPC